jgi:hypothetical protein
MSTSILRFALRVKGSVEAVCRRRSLTNYSGTWFSVDTQQSAHQKIQPLSTVLQMTCDAQEE